MGLPTITLTTPQEIFLDDLIKNIVSDCSREDILDFIKELDAQIEDWEFTLSLIKHFDTLKKQYEEETKK